MGYIIFIWERADILFNNLECLRHPLFHLRTYRFLPLLLHNNQNGRRNEIYHKKRSNFCTHHLLPVSLNVLKGLFMDDRILCRKKYLTPVHSAIPSQKYVQWCSFIILCLFLRKAFSVHPCSLSLVQLHHGFLDGPLQTGVHLPSSEKKKSGGQQVF